MNTSPMSWEFHDWLDKCPVQWFRVRAEEQDGTATATYTFVEEAVE